MKKIFLCVTTNLNYDQRMRRICTSLHGAGYRVTLVGRLTEASPQLAPADYQQVRLNCWARKGKLMYLEYNIRLFLYLLFQKPDLVTAIDLDTIIPCYVISRIRNIPRVYDAHEWFSELKEVVTRPGVRRIWLAIERYFVPRFPLGYTVSQSIADAFKKLYNVDYELIMNAPLLAPPGNTTTSDGPKFFLYQGAVNEGRGLEWLIPAMKSVKAPLWICGEGNFSTECRKLIQRHGLEQKVIMKGNILPTELTHITSKAYAGINLVEPVGMNQVYSLTNKYFDYIHAGIPQITMAFPEYERLNRKFPTAILLHTLDQELIAREMNNLLENEVLYATLKNNCSRAASELNWNNEEGRLTRFYMRIFR
jgi:glycosyltransferase involved in cell wall biosynthesis